MIADAADRLAHIKETIGNIRRLLAGKTIAQVESDVFVRAALERFLEIVSEASRHIPAEWKGESGAAVPWRDIANFGNVLRHAYDHVEVGILWSICTDDLDPLEAAIDAMLATHDK
jgi:uncharacterized protein with HEPN domain